MSGDIHGMTDTELNFVYNPTTFTTAEAEFEFRTSEFDYSPVIIKV